MKSIVIVVCATLVLAGGVAGCVSKYKSVEYEAPAAKLQRGASFYVMLPQDGQYNGKPYPNSGSATSQAVSSALATHATKVFRATKVEDVDSALVNARQRDDKYVFQTTILNWEDRATEWSGIPDKIGLKFTVYDASTGASLSTASSKASSKWATLGGDHPQDLLPIPTEAYVNSLF